MPQFAANLSWMYTEYGFLERFEAAANDGFQAVELDAPFAHQPEDIAARLHSHGLRLVHMQAPAAGWLRSEMATAWDRGERGTAAVPGRQTEFRAGVQEALRYADALDCPLVQVACGTVAQGVSRESLKALCVENLRWAAQIAAASGRSIAIEPTNLRDVPRYFLNRQDHAHELLDAAQAANLKVVMDLYHCQIVEGDVASKLQRYLPGGRVAHIQVAGVPTRQEPDRGELYHPFLFQQIDGLGYAGWVGCDYRPAAGTRQGLGWLPRH